MAPVPPEAKPIVGRWLGRQDSNPTFFKRFKTKNILRFNGFFA